jgi:hypothetical protein
MIERPTADDASTGWCEDLASPTGRQHLNMFAVWLSKDIAFQIYVGAGKRDYVPVDERVAVEGLSNNPTVIAHSG